MTANQPKIRASWLSPSTFINSDDVSVQAFAADAVGDSASDLDAAISLFYAVRDGWWYDPYSLSASAESFRASAILKTSSAWCTPKSIVLTAAARSIGIPARLGFADVRNHLSSKKLSATMGTDLFMWHGYSELFVDSRWFKLSTAFNLELCERFGVKPLEFDGTDDALMHPYDTAGNRHMEYVKQRGSFDDLPLDLMLHDFYQAYPGMISPEKPTSAIAADDELFADQ